MGTHGTTRSRAKEIVSSGNFRPSEEGWYSKGVYLWAVHSHPGYARENARLWWKFANEKKIYQGDSDPACAVLEAKIEKPAEYYDAATDEFNEKLHEIALSKGISEGQLKETLSWFVGEIAKELKVDFLVLKVSVPSPPPIKNERGLTQLISKMSPAYVVRERGLHLIKEISLVE